MRSSFILFILLGISKFAVGQSVAATNFNYWYNPLNEVELQIHPVRAANKIMIRYTLVARNGTPEKYSITWEARNSYVDREGVAIKEKDSVLSVNGKERRGFILLDIPEKPWLLLGHVASGSSRWTYFKQIESIYPVDGWIETSEGVITQNHLSKNKEYIARSADQDADVSRAGYSLISLDPNVVYVG